MNSIAKYFPIHPQTLRIGMVVRPSIFYKDEKGSYCLLHKNGDTYSADQQAMVISGKHGVVFVLREELPVYYQYIGAVIEIVLDDPLIKLSSKTLIIYTLLAHTCRIVYEGPTQDKILRLKRVAGIFAGLVKRDKTVFNILLKNTNTSSELYNHALNVGIFATGLALEMIKDIDDKQLAELSTGFFLHDIGRHMIPRSIREKSGPLTPKEWELMKKHPVEGFNLLQNFGLLTQENEIIILQHHERKNGSGYPNSLKGSDIHMYGKMCAIADAFDALTSNRPYRTSQSSFESLTKMRREMNDEFENEYFTSFIRLFSV